MGLKFDVIPSLIYEDLDNRKTAEDVARDLAYGKALSVAWRYPDSIVIDADTIVSLGLRKLGKPKDVIDAIKMLKLLNGKEHEVITAVAVLRIEDKLQFIGTKKTIVKLKRYNHQLIETYVSQGDSMDWAGSYNIQSATSMVEYIKGDYDNVVGLPTKMLQGFLEQMGIQGKEVKLTVPVKEYHKEHTTKG